MAFKRGEWLSQVQFLPTMPLSTQILNLKPTTSKDMKDLTYKKLVFKAIGGQLKNSKGCQLTKK